MRTVTSWTAPLVACLMLTATMAATASAQTQVEAGTLTCVGGEGVGLIVGSQKTYGCTFVSSSSQARESYDATITKIGLDVGITGRTTMIWTVLAASQDIRPGMLRGTYAGASADAAIGVGGGAKVLVGGSSRSIALQPVSVQGQSGVNLAVGVAGMTLR
jgi:hypothetical protein